MLRSRVSTKAYLHKQHPKTAEQTFSLDIRLSIVKVTSDASSGRDLLELLVYRRTEVTVILVPSAFSTLVKHVFSQILPANTLCRKSSTGCPQTSIKYSFHL